MADSLSSRLKALRSAQHDPPAGDKSIPDAASSAIFASQAGSSNAGPSRPPGSSREDEVERLIRITDDEITLEGSSHAPASDDEETSHGGLTAAEQGDDEDWEEAQTLVSNPQNDLLLFGQARRLLDKAERLQYSSQPIQREQRKKPLLLHRGPSSKCSKTLLGDDASDARNSGDELEALQRDLADALGEDGVNQTSEQVIDSTSPPRQNEIQSEVDALLSRFAALRNITSPSLPRSDLPPLRTEDKTSAVPSDGSLRSTPSSAPPRRSSDTEEGASASSLLSLPSVPLSEPHSIQSAGKVLPTSTTLPPAHPTLGSEHSDIPPELDLTPFRRLVGRDLDVRRLGAPTASSGGGGEEGVYLPWKKKKKDKYTTEIAKEEEEEEEEMFCSICSLPPTLICVSPQDPEGEGCMGDMYCSACWVEAHEGMQREELRDHRTKDLNPSGKGGGRRRRSGGRGDEGGNRRKPMLA